VNIYPNPVSDQMTINSNKSSIISIKVTTILGLELNFIAVENQNKIKVDLQNYANQVLFVEVKTAISTQVIKVLKK
jgi:hypothetical protein